MVAGEGIEPSYLAYETSQLPHLVTRIMVVLLGIEPSRMVCNTTALTDELKDCKLLNGRPGW